MSESSEPIPTPPAPRPIRAPSPRVTAALAAAMLAVGVALGAAIGPAPAASLGQGLPLSTLLPRLLAAAVAGRQQSAATAQTASTPAVPQAPPRRKRRRRARKAATSAPAAPSETSTPSTARTPTSTTKSKKKKAALAPVKDVWLIELTAATFESALASPAGAPYTTGSAVPAGTLLSGWSALDGSALANDAALLGGAPPQILETIAQPPCPEGAAGTACATGTPGALTAADEFLKQTLPAITTTAPYRTSGLIVVTFGAIAAGSAAGLPSGSTTATLTAEPPAGVLLISPFATAGARSTAAFDPSSPTRSLERLLHK